MSIEFCGVGNSDLSGEGRKRLRAKPAAEAQKLDVGLCYIPPILYSNNSRPSSL